MEKERNVVVWCLVCCSVTLNLCCFVWIKNKKEEAELMLSWSKKAAEEAEMVARMSCSGHGRAYIDGLVVDGAPECECHTCYGGPLCSQFDPTCPADANSGDPLFLEPFWMQNARSSAILVAGWHRLSYSYIDGSFVVKELELHIRKLHSIVGNAVTEGRYILFGAGSTQLLIAAVHALAALDQENSSATSSSALVVASIPFYPVYKSQTDYFRSVDFKFGGDTSLWKNASRNYNSTDGDDVDIIEFVTSPNNPDGQLKKAVLDGPNAKTIYDHAYYWPHYTPIQAPADGDLMTFTLSKLTGHAGSRFGWAVIKNEAIYHRMIKFLRLNTMGVSRETQLRALKLLKVVLADGGGGRDIFEFGYNTMKTRWERLRQILSRSNRFSLQNVPSQYCTFFDEIKEASPAYAWLKCERDEDMDCYSVLQAGNITGRNGSNFFAKDRYVRLSLIRYQDDFDLLLDKLNTLISEEDDSKTI